MIFLQPRRTRTRRRSLLTMASRHVTNHILRTLTVELFIDHDSSCVSLLAVDLSQWKPWNEATVLSYRLGTRVTRHSSRDNCVQRN
nr:hypothetical protein CFP56_43860 [Quercus suber]